VETTVPTKEGERRHILEEALRKQLQRVLTDQVRWKKPRDRAAFDAFDKLEKKGCDPVFLVAMLGIIAEAPRHDTWEGLTGFRNPDSLRTALKRLRSCAEDVDRLLSGVIGKSLLQSPSDHLLPSTVCNMANRVEEMVQVITPRRNPTGRAARGSIVRHVEDRTGGPHDRLVADILYPTLRCNTFAQNQWRQENSRLIAAIPRT
jgi:hypothetical protein